MSTSETIRTRALELAASDAPLDVAVVELDACCGGRRVSVVRARQELATAGEASDADRGRALVYLDELLVRLPA